MCRARRACQSLWTKLLIINNFRLFSPAKQGIIAPRLDGIKRAVTVIAPAETRVTDLLGRLHHIVQGKPVRELFYWEFEFMQTSVRGEPTGSVVCVR
jgi:hypothetical protein